MFINNTSDARIFVYFFIIFSKELWGALKSCQCSVYILPLLWRPTTRHLMVFLFISISLFWISCFSHLFKLHNGRMHTARVHTINIQLYRCQLKFEQKVCCNLSYWNISCLPFLSDQAQTKLFPSPSGAYLDIIKVPIEAVLPLCWAAQKSRRRWVSI